MFFVSMEQLLIVRITRKFRNLSASLSSIVYTVALMLRDVNMDV